MAAAAKTEWITREQLLDRYEIQESTLSGAEASDLLSVVEVSKNGRGSLTYQITEQTDLLFRVLRVFPYEISHAKLRLLPMQRALFACAIAEGIDKGIDMLRRRSILSFNIEDRELHARWNYFLSRAPEEAIPFLTRQTEERNEAVDMVIAILEMEGVFADPEIMLKEAIYNNFQNRGLTESLIQVGASAKKIAKILSEIRHLDIQEEHVADYRHYYYDPYYMTPVDVKSYCKKTGSIPGYTDILLKATEQEDVYSFIAEYGLAVEVEYEEEFRALLKQERLVLMQPAVGKVSQKSKNSAMNNVVKLAESLRAYHEAGTDSMEEPEDIVKLKHDIAANKQVAIEDLDESDLPNFVSQADPEEQTA